MKSIAVVLCFLLSNQAVMAQNSSQLTDREKQLQDAEKNRNEMKQLDQITKPNDPYSPTKVDTKSWGLDENVSFEITNHLFGYSTIMDKDYTLQGVKLTGLVNLAFYSPDKENDGTRKKGRFVFGMEFPTFDITRRLGVYTGVGLTLGDTSSMYLDAGLDLLLTSWFKAQGGLNYNFSRGAATQLSIGFTW